MAIEPSGWIRNRTLVAGLGGGFVALVGLALAPFWAALPAGVVGFLALRWHLSPRGLFGGIARSERPRVALVREILGSAAHDLPALDAAGRRIGDPLVAARVAGLAESGNELCRRLERRPQRLLAVQRLLTFYLPSALRLAESYAELETRPGVDRTRLAETGAMLERLDAVFRDYAGRLHAPEGDSLEVELRLLEQSLEEERAR